MHVAPASSRTPARIRVRHDGCSKQPRPRHAPCPRPLHRMPPGSSAMRMRQVVVFVVAVACSLGSASSAIACRVCDQYLHCITLTPGARICMESALSCSMLVPCFSGGGNKLPDGGGESLTTWSLFDPVGAPPVASVSRESGPMSLGDEALGSAQSGTLADAALVFGDDFAISLVDDAGDGFSLRRAEEGPRVRIEVREVVHDVPGRLLASDVLGSRDQLRVPVRAEGRDRVLLLNAARVPGNNGLAEVARLRHALQVAGRKLPPREKPLLRAHGE